MAALAEVIFCLASFKFNDRSEIFTSTKTGLAPAFNIALITELQINAGIKISFPSNFKVFINKYKAVLPKEVIQ